MKLKYFEVKNKILYYDDKVCVPKFGEHKLNIMNNLHDIPIAGHPCFQKIYMTGKYYYYWPSLKKNIKDYIVRCLRCQVFKSKQIRSPMLLQPLDVRNLKFESVSMDFIVGLCTIQSNFDSIMMVVDRLTKIVRFIFTYITITTYRVAQLFMREIFKYHRISREIINEIVSL